MKSVNLYFPNKKQADEGRVEFAANPVKYSVTPVNEIKTPDGAIWYGFILTEWSLD